MQSALEGGNRNRYDHPVLRKLRREEATLFLVGHAYIGHQGAREILELLFPVPRSTASVAPEGEPPVPVTLGKPCQIIPTSCLTKLKSFSSRTALWVLRLK